MKKTILAFIFSLLLLSIYGFIIFYSLINICNINTTNVFSISIVFQCFGLLSIFFFLFINFSGNKIKTGFFVPLLGCTVIYNIILDVISFGITTETNVFSFVITNSILVFIYLLITAPMYIKGLK